MCISPSRELSPFSLQHGALAVKCLSVLTASLSQRDLNQEATMAAESHPHPYNTSLSKESCHYLVQSTFHPGNYTLASCLWHRLVQRAGKRKFSYLLKAEQYPDNVWPKLAKACNIYQKREKESRSG